MNNTIFCLQHLQSPEKCMNEKNRKYMECLIKSIFHIFTENFHSELPFYPFLRKRVGGGKMVPAT